MGKPAGVREPQLDWVLYWYVCPDAVREIIHKLETMSGGIIGLVGLQGVEKSGALQAIYFFLLPTVRLRRGPGQGRREAL